MKKTELELHSETHNIPSINTLELSYDCKKTSKPNYNEFFCAFLTHWSSLMEKNGCSFYEIIISNPN